MAGKILLVEDELTILNQLKALLQAAGYEVLTASDGEAGWTIFLQNSPSAVVSALRMPNLDGLALLKRIRNRDQKLPVVLFADVGEGGPDTEAEARAMNVSGYVQLPVQDARDLTRWFGA
ncbi:MAG: response regulator [Aggregatilineales bacterium]